MAQFRENTWVDGRKKRKEAQILFYNNLPTTDRSTKKTNNFSCEKNEKNHKIIINKNNK